MKILSSSSRIVWPKAKACVALRASAGPDCLCGRYDRQRGYYLLGDDGHAVAYYSDHAAAVNALNERRASMAARAERVAAGAIPADLAHDITRDAAKVSA